MSGSPKDRGVRRGNGFSKMRIGVEDSFSEVTHIGKSIVIKGEASGSELRTDHVDVYQLHALSKIPELEQIFGPNGAMETFEAAKKAASCFDD